MKTIVFAGPSISESEVRQLVTCVHAPPIKRGDLETVGDHDVFVILDGEFGQNLSVTPKEILAVLEQGKTVIGASSMGALRASELDRSGMIGVGWVYNYLRRSPVRRDADVALVYSPFDSRPMTVPMVDLEYWMEQALAARLIAPKESARLLKLARNIFFADRTQELLLDTLRRAVAADRLDALLAFSSGAIPNVKAIDAREALRLSTSLGGTRPASQRITTLLEDNRDTDALSVPSRHLTDLLAKALLDRELCDRLLADPESIGREFGLGAEEIQAIKLLDRQKFEAAIARLRWG